MKKSSSLFDLGDNTIENKSNLFKLINPVPLDPNKKNVVMITNKIFVPEGEYCNINGHIHAIAEYYNNNNYNVIYISHELGKHVMHVPNIFILNTAGYKEFNANCKRKREDKNSVEYNKELLYKEFAKAFSDIKVDKVVFSEGFGVLPLGGYTNIKGLSEMRNEFFDYVGDDQDKIDEIKVVNDNIINNYDSYVSVIAFTMFTNNIFMNVFKWLSLNNDISGVYSFTIDPAEWYYLLKNSNVPHYNYYFADDNRGTRTYKEFPISQLQHIVYENTVNYVDPIEFENKTHNFFFMGSILQEKGSRSDMWWKFLSNFSYEKSSLWVPMKLNGVIKNKKDITSYHTQRGLEKANDMFSDLIDDINNHPNYAGYVMPVEVKQKILNYKYGLVLRCVSFNDSLNFRPAYYAYLNIIPFLDEMYDPDYLQIPKDIQDKIRVSSAEDIENKITYFNNNESERIDIINKLRELFKVDKFMGDWQSIIREYLD